MTILDKAKHIFLDFQFLKIALLSDSSWAGRRGPHFGAAESVAAWQDVTAVRGRGDFPQPSANHLFKPSHVNIDTNLC